MKDRNHVKVKPLDFLVDDFVDNVLNTSDEEILSEYKNQDGNSELLATEMLALFQKSLLLSNKQRMLDAKAGVIADREGSKLNESMPLDDISDARKHLHLLLNQPGIPHGLTLAARNEDELSDEDVFGILQDLFEIGVKAPKTDEGE